MKPPMVRGSSLEEKTTCGVLGSSSKLTADKSDDRELGSQWLAELALCSRL
jgi:hypothetical protein